MTFWPAQVRRQRNLPIAFCHVEGQEESSVISTSESNEESKRNMKEVRKAVCEIYPSGGHYGRLHNLEPRSPTASVKQSEIWVGDYRLHSLLEKNNGFRREPNNKMGCEI